MLLYRLEEQSLGQVSRLKAQDYLSLLLSGGRKLDASVCLIKFMSGTAVRVHHLSEVWMVF